MTGEIGSQPEETRDTGEEAENNGRRKLEDATLDPRASIEQSGDIRQAEDIQEGFTALVENAGEQAMTGVTAEIPSCDGSSKNEALPLDGNMRVERRFQWEAGTGEDVDAIPTNPTDLQSGTEATSETPACDGSSKHEALPLDGDVRVERRFHWEAGPSKDVGATPSIQPDIQAEAGPETARSVAALRETGCTLRALSAQPVAEELSASDKQKMETYNRSLVDVAEHIDQLAGQWEEAYLSPEINREVLTSLSDLTSERQLELQQLMEKKTQIEQTLSNVLKAFENTQRDLVANIK